METKDYEEAERLADEWNDSSSLANKAIEKAISDNDGEPLKVAERQVEATKA